jgi:hypothetical protein
MILSYIPPKEPICLKPEPALVEIRKDNRVYDEPPHIDPPQSSVMGGSGKIIYY